MDVTLLQNRLGHTFKDAVLLQQALTHRSHSSVHNERLEFLGDSILNCVVASLLFDRYSKIDEGDLSRLRANLVKQQSLYEIAQRLELSQFLRLGEGELKSGGFRRPSILADTLEALFGAIFLDAGFNAARDVIRSLYIPILDSVDPKTLGKDAKTLLQEYLQGKKIALPQYNVVATHGAAHNQEFEIECLVPKLDIQVFGTGGSRRAGEQAAAKLALDAVQAALVKTPGSSRKSKPRTAQLKLAGIATVQPDAPLDEVKPASKASSKLDAKNAKADAKAEAEAEAKLNIKSDHVSDGQKSLIAEADLVPASVTAPATTVSKSISDTPSSAADDVVKKSSTTSHSKIA
ncbi:ribonuclease III [Herminiimonas fonticola]|uniref:Ribonuclease 3 n=1 Tax=Herminiimonas fonticola TaxID=303380 RepID=A0A4R6GIX5_9BURK|nr:ribonuclease III [Herminiimonas fonticola]RBA25719.1 RNaseIII: ribonuclease III [Herminiimonas fonticola]TDN94827.1 RNAse III [Herminiimonas fonticola]